MKAVFFSLLMTFSAQALALPAYVSVEPIKTREGWRDEWDQTGKFCYKKDAKTNCAQIVQLGEVKIRDMGSWATNVESHPFINALSPQARKIAEGYSKLYIRYIGLENSNRFVAHMFAAQI